MTYYVAIGGNDANDGKSEATAWASVPYAVTTLRNTTNTGVVRVGPGTFDLIDTLYLPLGIQLWGRGTSGLGGTVLNYLGPDDGRAAVQTGNPLIFGGGFSNGKSGGFIIRGRVGMTGGGTAFAARNFQNMSYIEEIRIEQWPTGKGFRFYDDATPGMIVVSPGFSRCERLWAFGCPYPFYVESGFTSLTFDCCGIDMLAESIQGFTCTHKRLPPKSGVTATQVGAVATFAFTAHGLLWNDLFEVSCMPGYDGVWKVAGNPTANTWNATLSTSGAAPATGTVTPLARGLDLDLVLQNFKIEAHTAVGDGYVFDHDGGVTAIGCSYKSPPGLKSAFAYNGVARVNGNTPNLTAPPIVLLNCSSQGATKALSVPNFPGNDIAADKAGGIMTRFSYVNQAARL